MAYSNWGAFVYRNSERRTDKEDVEVFDTDEAAVPTGYRIFANILKNKDRDDDNWANHSHHAVLGDGPVRLCCGYKCYPELWHMTDNGPEQIDLKKFAEFEEDEEIFDYSGELDGYKFSTLSINDGNRVELRLEEPDGTVWTSICGFEYGAGFMD